MNDELSKISTAMEDVYCGKADRICIQSSSGVPNVNQFCFFLKPWSTQHYPSKGFSNLFHFIFRQIQEFGFRIDEAYVVSGRYLSRHRIIERHYGDLFISATHASQVMSQLAIETFDRKFQVLYAKSRVLGGYEFLTAFPSYSPESLNQLWSQTIHHKLASGAFCGKVMVDGQPVFLLNGFTPLQFATYNRASTIIPIFVLSGALKWKLARNAFLGAPLPSVAITGSIRRSILESAGLFGLSEVNILKNGAHLSAGPLEGLAELIRFGSDLSNGTRRQFDSYTFGARLGRMFSPLTVARMLTNPACGSAKFVGKRLFELTDDMDTEDACRFLGRLQLETQGLNQQTLFDTAWSDPE